MRNMLSVVLILCAAASFAQQNGFPYGQVTYRELELKLYDADTTAVAVVLDEFGEAYIDNSGDHNLVFEYHTRIKVLKQNGIHQATLEIPLRKSEGRVEKIRTVTASAYNVEGGSMRETKLEQKSIFTENQSKYYDVIKFAVPNVRVGTVFEVYYKLESPFIYNFRNWQFQTDIPKIKSEFWAVIPANYVYHIALKGFLELATNESERVRECFSPGNGMSADCSRLKYGMKNIPAFKEEDYMTAKSNFVSAITFELSQINYFDGRKDRITKEWKDADQELKQHTDFGVQIKRGKDIVDHHIDGFLSGVDDDLAKAKQIYEFIRGWYKWNGVYGKYSELGIKKAFDAKTGNVGDINLSLIAALKYAKIDVEPVLLSTRANGLPSKLYPVLSDFNYVIAKLNIGERVYLLDATDPFHPFGLIPLRCLNGTGRVLAEKESYWYDLQPIDKEKTLAFINLTQTDEGLKGIVQYTYMGYEAVNQRRRLSLSSNEKDYISEIKKNLNNVKILSHEIRNADDEGKPLVVKLNVEVEIHDTYGDGNFLLNPFISEQWKRNPFQSADRLYPVDFGAPLEEIVIMNLEYQPGLEVDGLPPKVGLVLPQNGGRYLFEITNAGNKVSMNSSLLVAKPLFTANEYHYLRELFNNVIAIEQTQLVFKQKK
jgi:hypothetical protein